eukprot:28195-Pyramimonas_sp.AAC.1
MSWRHRARTWPDDGTEKTSTLLHRAPRLQRGPSAARAKLSACSSPSGDGPQGVQSPKTPSGTRKLQ